MGRVLLTFLFMCIPLTVSNGEGAPDPSRHTRYLTIVSVRPEMRWVYAGQVKITAYCPNCRVCDTGWRTADMSMADHRRHIVAADKAVPFGLNVLIDGFDAPFTVRDRGQKVRGRHFDVLMRSHRDAVRWGVQHRDVWIRRIVDVEVHERVALTDAQ